MKMILKMICASAAALWLPAAIGQGAADYPSRTIRIVAPSSAGGGIDVISRIIGPRLTEAWKRPVVVENRPGAGGVIGTDVVAKAAPDGYTVLITASGYTLNPSLYAKLPYDTMGDFERVSLIACAPNMLVVHSTVPANSLKELIALAKAKPGSLNYASSGVGTTSYLSTELMKVKAGMDMVHVPYKGAGLSNAAAVAGEVQMIFSAPHSMIPFVRQGKMKALGVTSAKRLPLVPDVPTIAEAGIPGFEVNTCYGVLVPAKTPRAIVNKLHEEIVRILHLPEVKSQLEGLSFEVLGTTPDEFTRFAADDMARWAKELRNTGIKGE